MFELLETVHQTAFLRRTGAPAIDPYSDNWWLQGYNRLHYEHVIAGSPSKTRLGRFLRRVSGLTPRLIKDRLPASFKSKLAKRM
jgi:hypothetical protein